MIRFIICCIIIGGFLILGSPLLVIEWLIGKFNPHAKDISSLRIIQGVFRAITWVTGAKVTVIGKENIPKDQPVLYVGNHRSMLDIILTYTQSERLLGFVSKIETQKAPLFSNWMRNLHCLFLDRNNIKEGLKTILAGIEEIKSGISIFIFPEGTRNRAESDLDLMEFHEGSFKLATKSGCPIIPVAINNTCSIFEKQFPKVRPAHVVIEYCKPIIPSELSKEDQKHLGKYTRDIIIETLKKNEELL